MGENFPLKELTSLVLSGKILHTVVATIES
jgi:hypothetical protein